MKKSSTLISLLIGLYLLLLGFLLLINCFSFKAIAEHRVGTIQIQQTVIKTAKEAYPHIDSQHKEKYLQELNKLIHLIKLYQKKYQNPLSIHPALNIIISFLAGCYYLFAGIGVFRLAAWTNKKLIVGITLWSIFLISYFLEAFFEVSFIKNILHEIDMLISLSPEHISNIQSSAINFNNLYFSALLVCSFFILIFTIIPYWLVNKTNLKKLLS